jgi:chemotaxis protein methyltransferase CheR
MLWEEAGASSPDRQQTSATPLTIIAADVRGDLIERARSGVYPPSSVHSVPAELLGRYFQRDGDRYRLSRAVIDSVQFVRCDFYDDPIPGPVDLLLCRNSAFTYLAAERLPALAARLRDALHPGGYIMIGGNEARRFPTDDEFARRGRCLFRYTPASRS